MRYLTKILGLAVMALAMSSCSPAVTMAQDDGYQTDNGGYISNQQFYDELSPYGTWVYDQRYGDVWVPNVDEDFRPYATNGHWVYTDYGNTWVSDYDWGWAAFHYGRWTYDDYYGWEWVPGNEWAPAWVDWRESDGYYGWAPLTPGVSFDVAYNSGYSIPDTYWSFAPYAYINYTNVYNYCVPYSRVRTIYAHSNYIRNTYRYNNRQFFSGPGRDDIQRRTNRPVRVYNITNVNRPGSTTINRNSVNFYRPNIRRSDDARPSRVVDGAAYRRQNPNDRIGGTDNRFGAFTRGRNAGRLANEVRSDNPDSRFVRINNDRRGMANPANTNRPVRVDNGNTQPAQNGRPYGGRNDNNANGQLTDQQRQQMQQQREQQRQQWQQQRDQNGGQVTDQQRQQMQQQRQQWQQQREQQRQQQQQQQGQINDQQRQQQEQQRQQREQQRQQWQQQRQQNGGQLTDEQRQQQQQQRQQWQQQREQQQQMRQQQEQQQMQQQQRQQQDQVRQQQQEQQRQQMQQQREQQRQQMEQQRQQAQQQQQEQQRQQQEQQRQQMQQQREQQRQQMEQQRQQAQQQQQEQQRQQQEQQRQQMQQQREQQRQQMEQQRQQMQQQREQQRQQQQPNRPSRP